MGVATSRMPRDLAYANKGPLSINDSKHIIYFENFNTNKNNWPEGRMVNAEYYFENGQYLISNNESDKMITQEVVMDKKIIAKDDWMLEVMFDNVALESDAKASILWGKKGLDFISFGFSIAEKQVILDYGKNVEGAWVGGTKRVNGFVGNYKKVKLVVHKNRSTIDYYLNNKFVFSGPVEPFFGDEIAIALEGKAKVFVDEIVVKQLQFRKKSQGYSTDRTKQDYSLVDKDVIAMRQVGEYYLIPIILNNEIQTNFIFDPWTADVVVSEAMAKQMINSQTIKNYVDNIEYTFQDGSKARSARFIIDRIQLGDRKISKVECLILPNASHDILIGKSVLSQFGKYEYDTERGILLFEK
jgi:predicted aspartyl protease